MNRSILLLFSLAFSGLGFGQGLYMYETACYLPDFQIRDSLSRPIDADSFNHCSLRNLYPFNKTMHQIEPRKPKPGRLKWNKILSNKVFQENLVIIRHPGYLITADPLFDAELGRDDGPGRNTWINTRGVQAYGKFVWDENGNNIKENNSESDRPVPLHPSFEFYTSYYESQGRFPRFLDSLAALSGGIPGQGFILLPNGIWDHSYATGWLRYTTKRFFTFELGTGKNFFGNGYRSMLLSDNTRNYPYFRIDTKFWRIHYTNLWAEFQDNSYHDGPLGAYQKKYGAYHYLSYSVTDRFELSFFDAVIWQGRDSLHTRGFEINYLNPVIFLRPVEWTLGSPDNALMGINLSYKIPPYTFLYGQFIIDEFDLSQIKARQGFWGNKFGGQIGAKTFLEIPIMKRMNLHTTEGYDSGVDFHEKKTPLLRGVFLQSEFNFARPYTYSHWTTKQNYGHMGQALAHPLGANFFEWINFARFHYNRFLLEGRYSWAKFGANYNGLNFGQDIFLSFDSHVSMFGNFIGQGLSTILSYKSLTASYLINPSSLLNVFVTLSDRRQVNEMNVNHSLWLTLGVRNSLRNFYYDY